MTDYAPVSPNALAIEKLAIARVDCTRLDALTLKLKGRLHS